MSYAQGLQSSTSSASETLTLKKALSAALDRIEADKIRLEAADAYVKQLEAQQEVSDRALALAKEERTTLYRLLNLHEEEASRLRTALVAKENESISLRETIVAQDKIITKQNGKISFLKKVGKIAFVVGLGIGVVIGGRR